MKKINLTFEKKNKSRLFARALGYATHEIVTIDLFKGFSSSNITLFHSFFKKTNVYNTDVSCRDLLLRRDTDDKGNTIWQRQPLIQAILYGIKSFILM